MASGAPRGPYGEGRRSGGGCPPTPRVRGLVDLIRTQMVGWDPEMVALWGPGRRRGPLCGEHGVGGRQVAGRKAGPGETARPLSRTHTGI